jgi:hypothetical protein
LVLGVVYDVVVGESDGDTVAWLVAPHVVEHA